MKNAVRSLIVASLSIAILLPSAGWAQSDSSTSGSVEAFPPKLQAAVESRIIDMVIEDVVVLFSQSTREITVFYTPKIDRLGSVALAAGWDYPNAMRPRASNERQTLDGAKGVRQRIVFNDLGVSPSVVRVNISLARPNETSTYYVLASPRESIQYKEITTVDVYGDAILIGAPGLVMTFLPAGRVVKVAGLLLSGWMIVADAEDWSFQGSCPEIKEGQWYRTRTWYGASQESTIVYTEVMAFATKRDLQIWIETKRPNLQLCENVHSFEYL